MENVTGSIRPSDGFLYKTLTDLAALARAAAELAACGADEPLQLLVFELERQLSLLATGSASNDSAPSSIAY